MDGRVIPTCPSATGPGCRPARSARMTGRSAPKIGKGSMRPAGIDIEHIEVYRAAGRFAGWPANYGIWAWGDEIVLGFTAGYHDPAGGFHARDRNRPFVAMQARSLDGGRSWTVAPTPCRTPGSRGLSADEHVQPELWTLAAIEQGLEGAPTTCPGGVDFTHPDFALMCG